MAENDTLEQLNNILQIPITNYNFANSTKWIFSIPIGYIFKTGKRDANGNFLEYPLNCKRIQFPEFTLGTTKTSFMNYTFDVSTRQNLTEKGITITYNVSSNWLQYIMLLKWFQLEDFTPYDEVDNAVNDTTFTVKDGVKIDDSGWRNPSETGENPYWSVQGPILPSNLYLMNNFNKRIATINFEGSWLTRVKPVSLDYSKTSDTEIESSFELKFYKYNLIINDDALVDYFV